MTSAETDAIRELTQAFNDFRVEVAANMIPREEYESDQRTLHKRVDHQRSRVDRVTLKVAGIMAVGVAASVVIGIVGPYLLGG